jgi:hypothetical protein
MKVLKYLLVFVLSLGIFAPNIRAENPWYDQTPEQFAKKVKDPTNPDAIFGERYTFAQINWIINSLATIIAPNDSKKFIDETIKLINKARTGQIIQFSEYASLGVPGYILGSVSEIYSNPPASGVTEIKTLASRIIDSSTGVTPAYAQGYGFDSLSSVQTLWKAARNVTYLLIIIILIASGFMIMFRVKINPQTVVSLQVMIPKLVITLILVTFSFAIAGFVIDMVYVLITLFISMLQLSGVISPSNIGETIKLFTTAHGEWIIGYFLVPWLIILLMGVIVATIPVAATSIIIPVAVTLLISGSVMAIFALVITIFLLYQLVKIWWMLLKTYITLILLIAIGPLQIMLDLIPGQSGFGPWIRNIIANASVFVVVPMMFLLNMLFWKPFFGLSTIPQLQGALDLAPWLSPLGGVQTGIGTTTALPNLPFMNGAGIILNFAIGYVILSLTPKVADMIRDALKVPAFKYGGAMGEALAPVGWLYGAAASDRDAGRKAEMEKARKDENWNKYASLTKAEGYDRTMSDFVKRITKS